MLCFSSPDPQACLTIAARYRLHRNTAQGGQPANKRGILLVATVSDLSFGHTA